MDERLLAAMERLSTDLSNLERALTSTQKFLRQLAKETHANGERLETIQATQRFLANQQPRRDGTFIRHRENDDHD